MRTVIAGLVLLLISTHPLPAVAKIKADWSRVQKVTPGTQTRVELYKDRAPAGKRKIEGYFHSATDQAITLLLPDGSRPALQKQNVRKILIDRPPYAGFITAGASAAIFFGLAEGWDLNGRGWALFGGAFVGVPTVIAFLAAPKMGSIYHVPIEQRDDTAQTPTQRHSGPTALGVAEESVPDQLRRQARRALMRKGISFHSSGDFR